MLDFKLSNWFLSCWNCFSKSAKGWQVSISSQYSSAESFVSLWHRLVLQHEIQGSWTLCVRDALCVLTSMSGHHAMCLAAHFKGV